MPTCVPDRSHESVPRCVSTRTSSADTKLRRGRACIDGISEQIPAALCDELHSARFGHLPYGKDEQTACEMIRIIFADRWFIGDSIRILQVQTTGKEDTSDD